MSRWLTLTWTRYMAALPAATPQVAAAAMSVGWGRRRRERERKRPELDAGRAIAAANPASCLPPLCSLHAPGLPSSREQVAALRFFSSGERKRQDTKQCLVSFREHTALLFFLFYFSQLNSQFTWRLDLQYIHSRKTEIDSHTH